jgi:ubiquinone/menaquinone biosynthesis C-methylase UbiE
MDSHQLNSFQELFNEKKYYWIKNYLYNYLLRKKAVGKSLQSEFPELTLEIGSGISPVTNRDKNIVYSDISFDAIKTLRQIDGRGHFVVADAVSLPFKSNTYSHAICSEVLEHLENDRKALLEMSRILKGPHGSLIVTVPHRKKYFGFDDRYVHHYRRYELSEIKAQLQAAGFNPFVIQKVLGPLEKLTMTPVVLLFLLFNKRRPTKMTAEKGPKSKWIDSLIILFKWVNIFYKGYVWLDAKIMPISLATVILIKSKNSVNNENRA